LPLDNNPLKAKTLGGKIIFLDQNEAYGLSVKKFRDKLLNQIYELSEL